MTKISKLQKLLSLNPCFSLMDNSYLTFQSYLFFHICYTVFLFLIWKKLAIAPICQDKIKIYSSLPVLCFVNKNKSMMDEYVDLKDDRGVVREFCQFHSTLNMEKGICDTDRKSSSILL